MAYINWGDIGQYYFYFPLQFRVFPCANQGMAATAMQENFIEHNIVSLARQWHYHKVVLFTSPRKQLWMYSYLHLYPCNVAIHVIFLQVSFDMTKKIYFENQFDVIEN